MDDQEANRLKEVAKQIRKQVLEIIVSAHASHIASAYSVVEILLYLYDKVVRFNPKYPDDPDRDRVVLSKGWGVSALFAILAYKKVIPAEKLKSYCKDGSEYYGIAVKNGIAGIEATTGSMGHGLPVGVGMALAAKLKHQKFRVFVISGDGELDEGSYWEAVLQAAHFKLDNLVLIIDRNKWQSYGRTEEVLGLETIEEKFKAFGWSVKRINGHSFPELHKSLSIIPFSILKPSVIVADTIKGKGVSIFEDMNEWHYRTPKENDVKIALDELNN